jgi:hypothetical protein
MYTYDDFYLTFSAGTIETTVPVNCFRKVQQVLGKNKVIVAANMRN